MEGFVILASYKFYFVRVHYSLMEYPSNDKSIGITIQMDMVESDLDEEDIDKAFDNYRRTNNIQTTQV